MSIQRVNETKITAENAFNPGHIWIKGKYELKTESKTFF